MVFLLYFLLSLLLTLLFLRMWRMLPMRWLFDIASLSQEEAVIPHPKSEALRSFPHGFLLLLIFYTTNIILSQKVALIGVFGGLSLFWLLLQIAVSDFYYRLIPDQWSIGIMVWGFLRAVLRIPPPEFHLLSLVLCITIALVLYILPQVLSGHPAIGLGDVKLFFALSAALTPSEFLTIMISAALLGGAVAAGMLLRHHRTGSSVEYGLPYGTVIAGAAFFSLFVFL